MRTATFFGLFATLMAAELSAAPPADEIKFDTTRPMMRLAGELQQRYGYLVTYEDAPVPKEAMVTEKRRAGPDYSYPASKPVTFHVDARLAAAPDGSASQQPTASGAEAPVGQIRPLGPTVIDPLIQEYSSSGNPGEFKVIYDGDYAHIVPAGLLQGGQMLAFEPILSTEVAVNMQEGTCWDLLNGLVEEVQQARNVKIMVFSAPAAPWNPTTCAVSGHNLPARDVLIQLLGEMGLHPGFRGPPELFTWTFVYEPTTEAYFLSTQSVHKPEEPNIKPKVEPEPTDPAAANALIRSLLTSPAPGTVPVKKN